MRVRIVAFEKKLAGAFAALNYQWIEEHFAIEKEDRLALDNPIEYALEPGGEIFFLLENEQPVGTVAMVPKSNPPGIMFELAKMAVRPDRRGHGYGRMLMDRCISYAREQRADKVMLVTNDILKPAMGLYVAAGFEAIPQMQDARYERGNTEMYLKL